jgi:hypothetical protein
MRTWASPSLKLKASSNYGFQAMFNLDDESHAAHFDEVASSDVSISVGDPCHSGQYSVSNCMPF